jgi:hypothetical protein
MTSAEVLQPHQPVEAQRLRSTEMPLPLGADMPFGATFSASGAWANGTPITDKQYNNGDSSTSFSEMFAPFAALEVCTRS